MGPNSFCYVLNFINQTTRAGCKSAIDARGEDLTDDAILRDQSKDATSSSADLTLVNFDELIVRMWHQLATRGNFRVPHIKPRAV